MGALEAVNLECAKRAQSRYSIEPSMRNSWKRAKMAPARTTAMQRPARRPVTDSRPAADDHDAALSSSDQVVDHITSNILAGRYVPGQRLVEADVTHTLRVSRGPVREAFRRLDALGILSQSLHRGACVRTLSRSEAIDLLRAAEPLAVLAARLAAERFKSRPPGFDGQRFEKDLKPFRDREEDTRNLLGQRCHFYDVLITLSGNSALPSLVPTMRIHLLRLQIQSFLDGKSRQQHLDHYAEIAEEVLAGNVKAAEKAMTTHLRLSREAVNKLPDAAFPRTDEE